MQFVYVILEKILITGSSGFVGSHLSEYLNTLGYSIIGVSPNAAKKPNMMQIKNDVRNISHIPPKISCIVHLAALTDVKYCERFPKNCFENNVMGTQNMLELARKNDSRFIFASTHHVFGNPKKLPISEDAEIHPLSIYAGSKASAEFLCESYSKSYGLDVMVVRAFSIYGPRSPDHLVTTKIITQILNQSKIKVGNFYPKRDFLHISDLLSAYHVLINKNLKGFSKYNVGSGKSISIYQLCKKLVAISGRQISIESSKELYRNSEVMNVVCDTSKMKRLGWKPKLSLEQGLCNTFNWLKNSNS